MCRYLRQPLRLKRLTIYAVGLLILQAQAGAVELVLNTTGLPPLNTVRQDGFMDRVCTEAMARIGVQLRTVQLPAERGLLNANAGIEDGEMSRIAGLESRYPNLIRVPEKIMDWEFVGFSEQDISLESGWQALQHRSIAYINGWKIIENHVPQGTVVTRVKKPWQLFQLLSRNRVDLVIYEHWGGLYYLNQHSIGNIKMLLPVLARRKMYIYLNKKHQSLVPKLAAALRELKQDGTYQRFVRQILEPLN